MVVLSPGVNTKTESGEERLGGRAVYQVLLLVGLACRFQLTRKILNVPDAATLPSSKSATWRGPGVDDVATPEWSMVQKEKHPRLLSNA